MGRNPMVDGDFQNPPSRRYMLIGLAVVAPIIGFIAYNAYLNARIDRADDQVVTWKNRLAADKDEKGSWKQWADPLPDKDPWGHPLHVRYEREKNVVRLTVSSDGPDGKQWSPDDIWASESDTDWVGVAKDGAEAVEEVAGAASRGAVGGAIEGVTDHIPKPLRDKMGIPSSRDKKEGEKK